MKEFIVETGPYIKSDHTTKKISLNIFFVLLVFAIFAVIKNGLMPYLAGSATINGILFPMIFILTGLISGLLIDLLCRQFIKTNDDGDYYNSLNIALILTLILPMNMSLIFLAFSIIIAITFKYVMNKFCNHTILSPVLIGWGCIMGAYLLKIIPDINYLNPLEVDLGTPLANPSLANYDSYIKPYGSLLDFVFGLVPGGMGSTSALLSMVSLFYLSVKKIIKWRIPVVAVSTIFITTCMIGGFSELGIWYPIFQVCAGSLLFGLVFITSDSYVSPLTPIGQVLYGLFLGIIVVLLRYTTPLTDASLAVMFFMPLSVYLFDYVGSISRFKFNKSLIFFIVAWVAILLTGCVLGVDMKNKNEEIRMKKQLIKI